jgi:hypothetical protein
VGQCSGMSLEAVGASTPLGCEVSTLTSRLLRCPFRRKTFFAVSLRRKNVFLREKHRDRDENEEAGGYPRYHGKPRVIGAA